MIVAFDLNGEEIEMMECHSLKDIQVGDLLHWGTDPNNWGSVRADSTLGVPAGVPDIQDYPEEGPALWVYFTDGCWALIEEGDTFYRKP